VHYTTLQASVKMSDLFGDWEQHRSQEENSTFLLPPVNSSPLSHQQLKAKMPLVSDLTRLDLSRSYLCSIPLGLFEDFPLDGVIHLTLQSNYFTSLPLGIFKSFASLVELNIGQNFLETLPSGIFDSLVLLEELYISINKLISLPTDLFKNLQHLRILGLHQNRLAMISSRIFDPLENLQTLYLEGNRLKYLPPGLFDRVKLTRLDLDPDLCVKYEHTYGDPVSLHSKNIIREPLKALLLRNYGLRLPREVVYFITYLLVEVQDTDYTNKNVK